MDADLRKPCLAQIFNLDSAGGLSHVLSGSGTLTAHEVSPNLMVVTAGKVAGDVSPGEGRVLARLADGIVFVCRYGVTTKEALSRSEEILKAGNGPPILEIVVNGSRTGLQDYSYYLNPA